MQGLQLLPSFDSTPIELVWFEAKEPRKRLIFWPCGGGNVRALRLPRSKLLEAGVSLLFINPRSHGNSCGQFSFRDTVKDFLHFLPHDDVPLYALGHSMGCGGVTMLAQKLPVKGSLFVAPIIDSRDCLFQMYESGTISEFINLFRNEQGVLSDDITGVLSNKNWLSISDFPESDVFRGLDKKAESKAVKLQSIAAFLNELFIPGYTIEALDLKAANVRAVYLSAFDTWFDYLKTTAFCEKSNIKTKIVQEAKDHFFSGAWGYIIQEVQEMLLAD